MRSTSTITFTGDTTNPTAAELAEALAQVPGSATVHLTHTDSQRDPGWRLVATLRGQAVGSDGHQRLEGALGES